MTAFRASSKLRTEVSGSEGRGSVIGDVVAGALSVCSDVCGKSVVTSGAGVFVHPQKPESRRSRDVRSEIAFFIVFLRNGWDKSIITALKGQNKINFF